jgi:hypothetical protein
MSNLVIPNFGALLGEFIGQVPAGTMPREIQLSRKAWSLRAARTAATALCPGMMRATSETERAVAVAAAAARAASLSL